MNKTIQTAVTLLLAALSTAAAELPKALICSDYGGLNMCVPAPGFYRFRFWINFRSRPVIPEEEDFLSQWGEDVIPERYIMPAPIWSIEEYSTMWPLSAMFASIIDHVPIDQKPWTVKHPDFINNFPASLIAIPSSADQPVHWTYRPLWPEQEYKPFAEGTNIVT